MTPETINVGLHQGKVLQRLASHYNNLPAVLLEVVQNAIDSGAARIEVLIHRDRRTFVVRDNGSGASRDKVTTAVQSIGSTMKDKQKYGQFGLGLISPLSVVDQFTFTSCPTPRKEGYVKYTFDTVTITKQAQVSIPFTPVDHLTHNPDGATWWRTSVEARGITKDKRKSAFITKELVNDIGQKFGEAIRDREIQISVEVVDGGKTENLPVEAPEFSGEPLETFSQSMNESGKVTIKLFLARLGRGGRNGNITFGRLDNPSRISSKQFVECAKAVIDAEVSRAIGSGVFEGEVLCEKLVLNADRTRFEDDDALFACCEVLETWFKKVGKEQMSEAEEQTSNTRFQRIGVSVMPFAELLLQQEEFRGVISQIIVGTVGEGHAKVPRKSIIGPDEGTALSTNGRKEGSLTGEGGVHPPRKTPTKENPLHRPGIVYGGRGRKRTEVSGSSTGLRFEYVEMDEFRTPYEFDPITGTLSFNLRSPNWTVCHQKDEYLQEYHLAVVTNALTVELFRDHQTGHVEPQVLKFAYESLSHQVFGIKNGKALMAK